MNGSAEIDNPPVKLPKAGMTRRVSSPMKHLQRIEWPRWATAAAGWRWPAISYSTGLPASPAHGATAPGRAAHARRRACRCSAGGAGIVIAGDPDRLAMPRASAPSISTSSRAMRAPRIAVVETVAEKNQTPRIAGFDGERKLRERRARVIGRQMHAAPREARGLFEMEIGDDQRVEIREHRARPTDRE